MGGSDCRQARRFIRKNSYKQARLRSICLALATNQVSIRAVSVAGRNRVETALNTLRQVKDLIDHARDTLSDPVAASKYKGPERLLNTVKETVSDLIQHAKADGVPVFDQPSQPPRPGQVSAYLKNNLAYESSRMTTEPSEHKLAFLFANAQLSAVVAQLGSTSQNPESSANTLATLSKTIDTVSMRIQSSITPTTDDPMPLNGVDRIAS